MDSLAGWKGKEISEAVSRGVVRRGYVLTYAKKLKGQRM